MRQPHSELARQWKNQKAGQLASGAVRQWESLTKGHLDSRTLGSETSKQCCNLQCGSFAAGQIETGSC